AFVRFLDNSPTFPLTSQCQVSGDQSVLLQADQMAHAATIGAVAVRRDLPDRAITVALATALQESKLRNLAGGDRDSVGLFQQRPSQGWGTPEQLRDPRYAARAFYKHLVRVPGWHRMRLTEAAQAVQKSAHPEAYQKWSQEAEVLSAALSGANPESVTCTLRGDPDGHGAQGARDLDRAITLDWGRRAADRSTKGRSIELAVPDDRSGWRLAHWLVAHSAVHSISDVRFAGRRWNAEEGEWSGTPAQVSTTESKTVTAQIYPENHLG
ncbi:MAG: hypothetical protein ACRDT8_11545, partial [Micromonosporaceae bacterium]